jgi:hypothetical protein
MRKLVLFTCALLIISNAFAKADLNFDLNRVTQALLSNTKTSTIDVAQSKSLMEYGGQDIAHSNPMGNILDWRVLAA